ncbi:uncharacterized protein C6orf118-like isoform X2 [Betta splendens]|uniref:Uncharacterized protein C6orf118-like isoform X2 n=1 Tax=Betta splendens TaxID=158456 RepID=A0A6P7PED5_BETSP|nr:uncharacterized protein C6orf118-like isoform X2 [Betta splendens]
MSRGCKPERRCFGSDVHRLLAAAEAGQKADILAYYAGHLGPSGLNQNQPHQDKKQVMWKLSRGQEEDANPVKLPSGQTKAQAYEREKGLKESHTELTAGTASLESQHQDTDYSSHASRDLSLPKIIHRSSNSLRGKGLPDGPAKSKLPPILKHKNLLGSDHARHRGVNNEDQPKAEQRCGRSFTATQNPWTGRSLAETHERKLQEALQKLPAQSWPHRDRLAVFSDVFDDVCETSPVFGRILREIKTDYDLYVNYMMASSSPPHNPLSQTPCDHLGSGRLREMQLEEAEAEVSRLEEEAREALEEHKRIQNELRNVPAVAEPQDSDMMKASLSELLDKEAVDTDGVHTKRLQVLNTWREIQQLEEEIEEKLVCDVTTAATEESIKVLQTEIVRLIASNECLKTANRDLKNKINAVLNREKLNKTQRRLLWDEILAE